MVEVEAEELQLGLRLFGEPAVPYPYPYSYPYPYPYPYPYT